LAIFTYPAVDDYLQPLYYLNALAMARHSHLKPFAAQVSGKALDLLLFTMDEGNFLDRQI
jgi:hypothetical protein